MSNTNELSPAYSPKEVEEKWYAFWETNDFFAPRVKKQKGSHGSRSRSPSAPYTIVIPPPNVTGILHMGHALNNTIQDILIRWHRMKGEPTLWLPGTDHAGIATQNVVERRLAKEGKSRESLGRELFIQEIWKWKEEYGSTIVQQLRRLGASCDWSRERFTMDEGLTRAVREAFVHLYEKGLIYRGTYIINWCPRCLTALSDEEAPKLEVEGKLYHIRYPLEENREESMEVATTRPETMLGDTAVAVNPKDERYRPLVGKKVVLPLLRRLIPVIQDPFVDPEFGTGIVKVTPAHDPNDFLVGKKHRLPEINIFHPNAAVNEAGGSYAGLDRFEARRRVVEDLEKEGLLVKVVPHHHAVGHCYRCHTVIEPYLSQQWFVRMKPLAGPAIRAAIQKKIQFIPKRWTKVYLSWMREIRDWCISRQIWWGHQIPVWYCDACLEKGTGKISVGAGFIPPESHSNSGRHECRPYVRQTYFPGVIVSRSTPPSCPHCGATRLRQDPDVLDTWFSSWLWPFSTLGWPEKTADLKTFYPTSDLVTAPDIIFFWVARMIVAGLEFKKAIPFRKVYIHGTVRTDTGEKMSKSKGNIIDPIELVEEIGADALRFSITMLTASGQDAYLSRSKFELGRNFTNKIWNAARFVLRNLDGFSPRGKLDPKKPSLIDQWILSRLERTLAKLEESLRQYRLNEAAGGLYQFFWHDLCDWYLELAKPRLFGHDANDKKTVQGILIFVFEHFLRALHPFMPFITEELWQKMEPCVNVKKQGAGSRRKAKDRKGQSEKTIMLAEWPRGIRRYLSPSSEEKMRLFQESVTGIRDLRLRLEIPPAQSVKVYVKARDARIEKTLTPLKAEIAHLTKADEIVIGRDSEAPPESLGKVFSHVQVFLCGLKDFDRAKERERVEKKIAEIDAILRHFDSRLSNPEFLSKAPEEIVDRERAKRLDLENQKKDLQETLRLLGSNGG